MEDRKWYDLGISEVFRALGSRPEGLTSEEAKNRLVEYGRNELIEEKKTSVWALLGEQFKSVLIIILLVAVALSVIIGILDYTPGGGLPEEVIDAIVIFVIVIAVVFLGFIEEYAS